MYLSVCHTEMKPSERLCALTCNRVPPPPRGIPSLVSLWRQSMCIGRRLLRAVAARRINAGYTLTVGACPWTVSSREEIPSIQTHAHTYPCCLSKLRTKNRLWKLGFLQSPFLKTHPLLSIGCASFSAPPPASSSVSCVV